ncbi:hypothetical protein AB0F77_37205 [Streptomyces sp. NPDC026672]|uniref:hypothetical protein n=1 Tax=unclassified Streptomyces TaxID=2593676 RepID=UPI0033CD3043
MHRTTTAAALLVTVAASVLSGCVTVQRPSAPGPGDSASAAPRPDGSTRPAAAQAPGREALERVGPSGTPKKDPRSDSSRAAVPPLPPAPPGAYPGARPRHEVPRAPAVVVPAPSGAAPGQPNLCDLGRKYGGWRPGSPESRICDGAYGR